MKKVKNVLIIIVVLVAIFKAIECYEVLMLANCKATLTLIACVFVLWAFWKANYQEEQNGQKYIK